MKLILLSLVILISSCSKLKLEYVQEVKMKELCRVQSNDTKVFGENKSLNKMFSKRLEDFSFIDSYIYWSLTNLVTRPEATTTNSSILTYIKYKGQEHILSMKPRDDDSETFFPLMNETLKFFKHRKSLTQYAYSYNQEFPSSLPIEDSTQEYIAKNKAQLYKIKEFRKVIFRGTQIIKKGEKILIPSIRNLIKNNKKNNVFRTSKLFRNQNYQCNFDQRLYGKIPSLQKIKVKTYSNVYGIFKDKDNYFITATSSSPVISPKYKKTFILRSKKSSTLNVGFCKSSRGDHYLLMKNENHTKQLLSNVIKNSSKMAFDQLINHKRFLNLLYPRRSVIEIYGEGKTHESFPSKYYLPRLGEMFVLKPTTVGVTKYSDPRTHTTCN